MCTLVLLMRPQHRWPLIIAANRDEMRDRPWRSPGRHWPDHPRTTGGQDVLAGGTWLAINDNGVVAAVLNRLNTLGPAIGSRSRGELPLLAAAHPDARLAARAIREIDPAAYRSFNLVVADRQSAFWIRSVQASVDDAGGSSIEAHALPAGLSMVTAYDCNDTASPRIRRYLPRFRQATEPDPDSSDWSAWQQLLACRDTDASVGPGGGMMVIADNGFGTTCSSLIAIPDEGPPARKPIWLFAPGRPDEVSYYAVQL